MFVSHSSVFATAGRNDSYPSSTYHKGQVHTYVPVLAFVFTPHLRIQIQGNPTEVPWNTAISPSAFPQTCILLAGAQPAPTCCILIFNFLNFVPSSMCQAWNEKPNILLVSSKHCCLQAW